MKESATVCVSRPLIDLQTLTFCVTVNSYCTVLLHFVIAKPLTRCQSIRIMKTALIKTKK